MRREWTTIEIKKVRQLYEAGLSHDEIVNEIGRPWSSIKYIVWKYGMKRDPLTSGIATMTGVGSFFCAAHRDIHTGALHGHTWDVVAWFRTTRNAVDLRCELDRVLKRFDHQELSPELAWGETIAVEILRRLTECIEVEVKRESERIYAKAKRRNLNV